MENGQDLIKDPKSLHYGNLLLVFTLLNFTIGILFYPGRFSLVHHAFSHLGNLYSLDGHPNNVSMYVNQAGMIICGWILFRLGRYHLMKRPVPNSPVYWVLSWLIALGYLLMVCPADSPSLRLAHVIGSALVVGGFVFLVLAKLLAIRPAVGLYIFWLATVSIMVPVLAYAFMWLIRFPGNPLFQKFAIISLIAGIYYTFRVSRIRGETGLVNGSGSVHDETALS